MKKYLLPLILIMFGLMAVCYQPVNGKRKIRSHELKIDTCHYVNPTTGKRCGKLIIEGSVYCFKHRPFS